MDGGLAGLQDTFGALPWWLRVLLLAIIVVALAQWTRNRYR